jgi:serine phosphatase RsbU (regulator of sigma subunit)
VLLDGATGTAVIRAEGTPREEATVDLPPGSTLVPYTDGLAECPGTDIDDNLAAVAARASAASDLEELCDDLLQAAPVADDVAPLVVRVRG